MEAQRHTNNSHLSDYAVWCAFLLIGLVGLLNHEMWMDEAHHWLIIRDIRSFSEFIQVESVDGQPFIWPILLFLVHSINDSVLAFQLFHFCIGATSALLFIRHAPFDKSFRYLFVLSYPMIYEYLVIGRNYSLSILILFIFLIYFRKKGILAKALMLGILANTHFFAAILATMILVYEVNPKITDIFSFNRSKILAYLIFLFFIILLFLQLKNSLNHAVMEQYNSWSFFERCKRLIALHFRSFIVIPDFSSVHFWGSVWPFRISSAFGLLAIPIFFFPFFFFRDRKIQWLYYATVVFMSVFLFSIHQPIASRYACFIFIVFIAFYWVQREDLQEVNIRSSGKYVRIIKLSIFIQVLSGLTSIFYDYRYAFSQGKNVAEYILENDLDSSTIIIHPYSSAPSISLYLGKPYYSLLTNDTASFCRWETNPFMISNEEFYGRLSDYMASGKKDVLLVRNTYSENDNLIENELIRKGYYENQFMKIEFVKAFEPSVVSNEGFTVYKVKHKYPALETN